MGHFASREERDRINAAVMKDPRCSGGMGHEQHALRPQAHVLGRLCAACQA